jgi:hypothetical protein
MSDRDIDPNRTYQRLSRQQLEKGVNIVSNLDQPEAAKVC